MTREDAIKNIKEHCYFANLIPQAKEALDVAIKALELTDDKKEIYNKGYKDGQEALAFHLELCKEEQEPILDKIRAEIIAKRDNLDEYDEEEGLMYTAYEEIMGIIDKYKADMRGE